MKILFWFSLLCILYTYAGYPVIIWLLARLRPRRWKVAPITPSVSIVLAVHNGVALLPQKIDHLLSLDYPNIQEIIIVSDGSTDGTAELLADYHRPRLIPVIMNQHVGKAVALNIGMAQAHADVILFVDIRPEIAPGAIQHLVANFADPKVGCVAGELMLRQGDHDGATAAIGGLYWRYEKWIRKCEGLIDSPVGVSGCFYAIRRELAVEQPVGMILDDLFQPLSVIRQGYRSVIDSHAQVEDTLPLNVGGEFYRKVRTLAGNFELFRRAPWTLTPQNRVFLQFISHKVMRLAVPYLLALLLVSALALSSVSPIYVIFAAAQALGLSIAIVGLRYRIPVLDHLAAPASALLLLNAAAVAGLHRFLFTRRPLWQTWNPNQPRSAAATRLFKDESAPKPVAVATAMNTGNSLRIHSGRR